LEAKPAAEEVQEEDMEAQLKRARQFIAASGSVQTTLPTLFKAHKTGALICAFDGRTVFAVFGLFSGILRARSAKAQRLINWPRTRCRRRRPKQGSKLRSDAERSSR
jgi:hypothetical protein